MQIELNNQEVHVVMDALKAYESAPQFEGLLSTIMLSLLLGKSPAPGETDKARAEAAIESEARKMICIPILAKLVKQDFAAPVQAAQESVKG